MRVMVTWRLASATRRPREFGPSSSSHGCPTGAFCVSSATTTLFTRTHSLLRTRSPSFATFRALYRPQTPANHRLLVTMARFVKPDADGYAYAGAELRAGRLIAFPTETVYGLGANALN